MSKFLLVQIITLANIYTIQCGILDPLDELHNNSGLHKILSGINDIAENVGKIGARLFNNSIKNKFVKVKEYQVHKAWEVTTWTTIDEHEIKDHGRPSGANHSKIEDHEVNYHGQPKASRTIFEHEAQFHTEEDGKSRNLKEHEAKHHNNFNAPCSDIGQHETIHHKRNISSTINEHINKYHTILNTYIRDHEEKYHNLKENPSKSLEEHIRRFHPGQKKPEQKTEEELINEHEEQLHKEDIIKCPYKKTCHYLKQNKHVLLWGLALFGTFLFL